MSHENVEIARTAFEALNHGGFDEALAYVDPEIEFEPPDETLERPRSFKGHEALRERWKFLLEPFEDVRLEPVEFIDVDDIWLAARGVLTRVKALLVIGYSLPLTDVYTQAMLRIDVPDLDFLLIANPDSEARQRTRHILRSALRSSTRVVELDEMRDVGLLLGADVGDSDDGPGADGLDDSDGQA